MTRPFKTFPRLGKYNAKKTVIDGIEFDSKREAKRYVVLKAMLDRGEISNLERQVKYELVPSIYRDEIKHLKTKEKTVRKCVMRGVTYVSDFEYDKDGKHIVEDSKGMKTKEYIIKKKLMAYLKNIIIQEV